MTKTKASLWVIAATVVTAATLFLLPCQPRVAVRTAVIGRGPLVRSTMLEGAVAYLEQRPCVALQAGRVTGVHCAGGQAVAEGQLLFTMDTAQEEKALAALYAKRHSGAATASAYGEAVSAALFAGALSMDGEEAALLKSIESKRVRAPYSGVVSAVYAAEGEPVAAGTALGVCRGVAKCVTARWQPGAGSQPETGKAAALYPAAGDSVPGYLYRVGAPDGDAASGALTQTLSFLPGDGASLDALPPGEPVTVELLETAVAGAALAPVEAVGAGNLLWVVRDGAVQPVKVSVGQRNESFVAVPEGLLGERVVLLPDEAGLAQGTAVKEAKSR